MFGRFLYLLHKKHNNNIKDSVILILNELKEINNNHEVLINQYKMVDKLKKLLGDYGQLKKNRLRRSKGQKLKEELFINKLEKPFIFLQKSFQIHVEEKVRNPEVYVEVIDDEEEHVDDGDEDKESEKEEVQDDENQERIEVDDSDVEEEEGDEWMEEERSVVRTTQRNIYTPELLSTLDRCKVSSRNGALILGATAQALGHDPKTIKFSRESLRAQRMKHRAKISEDIKLYFKPDVPLTIHWDGKMLPALTSKKLVDRMAIIVSGDGVMKLLAVPVIGRGTGKAQADSIYETLEEWNLTDRVKFMSFDTTASNTGIRSGACTLLEERIGRSLVGLACRHHIHELIIAKVYDCLFEPSTGPNIKMFQKFRESFATMEQTKFDSSLIDKELSVILIPYKKDLVSFIHMQLECFQKRDDYKELLILTLLFLGETPKHKFKILAPGALHRARWMAKIIYSLKIYLFRQQFELKEEELSSLKQFNLFFTIVYIKNWYTCEVAAAAPLNDLSLLKDIRLYESINKTVSDAAFHSFSNHGWYLSDRLVGLSFFDDKVPVETKAAMVLKLQTDNPDSLRRIKVEKEQITSQNLPDFTSINTMDLFTALEIETSFLDHKPSKWNTIKAYLEGKNKVKSLKVVNDAAERGIALISTFNDILTNKEDQKQYLLQVVERHRSLYKNTNKSTIVNVLSNTKSF